MPLGSLRALEAMALVLFVLKLLLVVSTGPFMDEAYYWMWSQHPALSYYDHPPLNAWLQAVGGALFGWNLAGLRAIVILALVGDIFVLYLFARRLGGAGWRQYFLVTLIVFLATPIFFSVTAVALPDHLLILCSLAALYCFVTFLEGWRSEAPSSYLPLYAGAACLGLAALAKYNAALLALGFALFIVFSPRFRPLLARPQLYLAGLIALVLQAPVLAWNFQQNFASFAFILRGRHQGLAASFDGVSVFLLGVVVFLLPFLFVPLAAFLFSRERRGPGAGLARCVFVLSTLAILGVSFFTKVLFHWNLIAYVAMLPFLAFYLRPGLVLWGQALLGAAFLFGLIVNYAVAPIFDVEAHRDEASAWAYGWEETAAAVAQVRAETGAGFTAATDYTIASLLGFALKDKDVTSLSGATEQYDFWFEPEAHAGESAVVLADNFRGVSDRVRAHFGSLTLIRVIPVVRSGKVLDVHRIYLGEDFRP